MDNVIKIQQRYIETRKSIERNGTFGLARTMAVGGARSEMRKALLPFASSGKHLEQMIQDAIDMYELEAWWSGLPA